MPKNSSVPRGDPRRPTPFARGAVMSPAAAGLHRVLRELNASGGFSLSVLTDAQGLPVAWASADDQSSEAQAAVVALVQRTAGQARERLGMAATDEVSVFDRDGRRLVCRPFTFREHGLILAVMVPDRRKPYRALTNRAVGSLRGILETVWE